MVDTQDLKSCDLNSREGSIPSPGTHMDEKITFQVAVKAIITNDKGEYLLMLKPDAYKSDIERGMPEKRRWDIPGGRVNAGEKVRDALAREVLEETGLKVIKVHTIVNVHDAFFLKDVHVVRMYFPVDVEGVFNVSDEHERGEWMSLDEIKKLYDADELEGSTTKLFADLAQW